MTYLILIKHLLQDLTLDKDEIARDLLSNSDENEDEETDVHDLMEAVSSSQTARLLRCKVSYNFFIGQSRNR